MGGSNLPMFLFNFSQEVLIQIKKIDDLENIIEWESPFSIVFYFLHEN